MKIDYDWQKNQQNIEKHGLDFEQVLDLDFDQALFQADERFDYGEVRQLVYAPLNNRLHIVCFTVRGEIFRIINFRKANKREVKYYEQAINTQ